MAHEVEAVRISLVCQGEYVVDELAEPVVAAATRLGGRGVATLVGGQDTAARRYEFRRDGVPCGAVVREPVQQDDGTAADRSGNGHVEAHPVADEAVHHPPLPAGPVDER